MKIDVLVAEIGSTTTVVNAFDHLESEDPVFLGQGQAPTSVKEGDVNIGLQAAIEDMRKNLHIENEKLEYTHMLATSSAAGGLRMTVHGLVYDMTVKAAKEAALGAGANIHLITAGKLSKVDMIKLDRIKPNIILIAGGVDYGERETALYNSELIAASDLDIPVIYAGNIAVADDVKLIFEAYSKEKNLHLVPNVYPKIDILNIEPTREVIQDIFEKHITEAKGMEKIREMVNGPIIPTPGAVMKASKILKDEIGDLVTIDVGGATTDIHSVTEGTEKVNKILVEPEPVAKRTVEGDLGMRYSSLALYEATSLNKIREYLGSKDSKINIRENFKFRHENPDFVAETEDDIIFDEMMAMLCTEIAMNRHVGTLESIFSPMGTLFVQNGKDLTDVKYVIGTGGIINNSRNPRKILDLTLFNEDNPLLLKPKYPKFLVDKTYIMSAMGLLANDYPDIAYQIMKEYLVEI